MLINMAESGMSNPCSLGGIPEERTIKQLQLERARRREISGYDSPFLMSATLADLIPDISVQLHSH